jgi:two-component system, LuxR family, sensor kinase FixL
MSSELLDRYRDLQAYVGWNDDDVARVKSVADVVEQRMDVLIDDFYAEIKRHPDAARVITGGQAQIARLMASLRAWLSESLKGRSDEDYVVRRWKIGLRHAEIGLNPAYTSAAMSRLRNGLVEILSAECIYSPTEFRELVQSFNKLLDLDLSVIQDAYQAEYLRLETLAEHERSEVKFRRLVEAAAGMVVIMREDGTIAYFSPYSENLTGYQAEAVIGKQFVSLFIPDWARTDVTTVFAATMAGQPAKTYETPMLHRDGSRRWFVWNAQRLDDFEGSPAVLAVGQDFTERREAQERMLRSERLAGIGQMITGIAHESRNALQRIQSCTEMLELEVENNNEAQRLVRRLQEAQDNLLRLFDEVRGYAAPIQLERTSCRVDSVWRESWQLLKTLWRDREAMLVENSGNTDLNAAIDRFRMVQVFRNLLENSLAACSDPVVIHLECRDAQLQGQPAIDIRVRDNGPGLTPSARQSVFEPFFTTKTKGTGLGMAIARRIVEAHAGQISIGDESSTGAEFIITLLRNSHD